MRIQRLTLLPLLCFSVLAGAETVEIPIGQQAHDKQSIDRPIKGMNKQQVEAIFGKPSDWRAPTGEPPISSWIYDDFVVYFEHDFVIHTVLKHISRNTATDTAE